MSTEEFSNEFDTLLSSYRTRLTVGGNTAVDEISFDEYEKSMFLTTSQENLVISLYNGTLGNSFEETEALRRYLANLVVEYNPTIITTTSGNQLGMESNSKFYTLPEDLWFITYEKLTTTDSACGNAGVMDIIPIRQDEYNKIKRNPFRGLSKRRAFRLDLADGVVEILCKYTIADNGYYIRYIKKLEPIVLVSLPNGLSINGVSTAQTSKLHEALHRRILEGAVALALQSRGIGAKEKNS